MRRDVVAVTIGLCVVAAGVLIVTRPSAEAMRATTASAPQGARPASTATASPITSAAQAVAAASPVRRAVDRSRPEDRLFRAYERLRAGTSGGDLWNARRTAADCHLAFFRSGTVAAILAGQPINRFEKLGPGTRAGGTSEDAGSLGVVRVVPTEAQVDAARELRRRCDGFQSMTSKDFVTQVRDLDNRLSHIGDAVGLASSIADRLLPATPERLRTILASEDPVAITLLDDELGERWRRRGGAPVEHALFGAPSPAMQLIACDLEVDCSSTSRTALIGCIDDADGCGLDIHRQLMRLESPRVQMSIEETRATWLHAITSGDYGIWGL